MAVLSARLKTLAQQINEGETMADIGTDHGFLPIYLHTHSISPKVVMTDVSDKSLSKARENGQGIPGISDSSFRCGDGLSPIHAGEVDAVVMAGMGGMLMVEILSADLSKAKTIAKYVLQPRNHAGALRSFLAQNGFSITKEVLVREGRHLCEIILASPIQGTLLDWPALDIRWEVPLSYGKINDPLADEYLHRKMEREKRVLRDLHKAKSLDHDRVQMQYFRIEYLKNLIETRRSKDEI